ncbi:hypothetical protein [Novipirellula galeiformis]|uniref:hypothetical protein n=1 Tax=Novipirellula galeiformis TaxID=2528004 RepID=UPI0011B7F19D|nr:hypothetical protein [Novipirellula galeiformis]
MRKTLLIMYICFGLSVCVWYSIAAAKGWRAPNLGVFDGMAAGGASGGGGYGRSYGGSWGGGK